MCVYVFMCLCVYVFMTFTRKETAARASPAEQCVSVCSVWRIGVCEIAANAENRRQIGGYIIAPKSHLTAKTEGRAKAEGRSGVT
jgi:hypothetical protein